MSHNRRTCPKIWRGTSVDSPVSYVRWGKIKNFKLFTYVLFFFCERK